MLRGVLTTTCAAALAALAVATPSALAAPGTVTDTDFNGGTAAGTVAPGGILQLPLGGTRNEMTAFPAGWEQLAWPSAGMVTTDGRMTADGARAFESATSDVGQVLEFRASFGNQQNEHVGFGIDFDNPPWAMFSTSGSEPGLYARTFSGSGSEVSTAIPGFVAGEEHDYRIEWASNSVRFFRDGTLVATHDVPLAGPMRAIVSDYVNDGTTVKVDWLQRGAYTTGKFTSAVLDANDPRAQWGSLAATAGVAFSTRTGNTATPDLTWSDWAPVAGGQVQSPMGRFIQYEATLTATSPTQTPTLDSVAISYDVDDVKPAARIDGVDISGTSASVRFASGDSDVARFECSLDGGAFTTCMSPKAFAGLAPGAHAVAVRAIDKAGNVGDAASRSFSIAAPPSTGGGGTPGTGGGTPGTGGGGTTPGATDVAISLVRRSVRANKGGIVKLQLKCRRGERRCTITVRLKRGGKVVATKTARIDAGATRTVSMRLAKSVRTALATKRSVKLSARLVARDAAGHTQTITRTLTVKAPR